MILGLVGSAAYLNDIVVVGDSEKELQGHDEKLLYRSQKYGFNLRGDKCQLFLTSVKYLGFISIRPIPVLIQTNSRNCHDAWSSKFKFASSLQPTPPQGYAVEVITRMRGDLLEAKFNVEIGLAQETVGLTLMGYDYNIKYQKKEDFGRVDGPFRLIDNLLAHSCDRKICAAHADGVHSKQSGIGR
ncbi:unnamed protein product [Hymenolepis diminuta]|uniref:Reverse transcriptase domain-containing protein n=1 Tax=Hymenolepis diminuta TaxID=6216 RepID=A0A0R3S9S4_HYMDI|nr:unnamed protein product [Hymenolepis diminuta]